MAKQLSLLDDPDASPSAGSTTWSGLPEEVRVDLTEKLAELLVRIVQCAAAEEEQRDDAP